MSEGITKFAEKFTKNQLIAYFLILWAATFLFSSLSGFVWLTEGYATAADFILDIPWNLAELGIAAVLAMLGLKILNEKDQN